MNLEKEIIRLQNRNKKVEEDKAWETSFTRRFFIAGTTYLLAVLFMKNIAVPDFYFNALIPTGGYILSTLSIPFIKKLWRKLK